MEIPQAIMASLRMGRMHFRNGQVAPLASRSARFCVLVGRTMAQSLGSALKTATAPHQLTTRSSFRSPTRCRGSPTWILGQLFFLRMRSHVAHVPQHIAHRWCGAVHAWCQAVNAQKTEPQCKRGHNSTCATKPPSHFLAMEMVPLGTWRVPARLRSGTICPNTTNLARPPSPDNSG